MPSGPEERAILNGRHWPGPELKTKSLPIGRGLAVVGPVDVNNRSTWQAALDWLQPTGEEDVILDLSGLSYIDAGGVAMLAGAVQEFPPGRRMLLRHPPQILTRLLDLLWPDLSSIEVDVR